MGQFLALNLGKYGEILRLEALGGANIGHNRVQLVSFGAETGSLQTTPTASHLGVKNGALF